MKIQICEWKSCREKQSKYLAERVKRDALFYKWEKIPEIENCLCLGNCRLAPNIKIDGVLESYMSPIKLSEKLQKKIISHR